MEPFWFKYWTIQVKSIMVSWYNYVWKLVIKLNYEIIDVKQDEKEKLYKLLQYALYDGSQYIDNDINEDCIF